MKKICAAILGVAAIAGAMTQAAGAADFREHRGVWVTPFLSDWPSSSVTTGNASRHISNLQKALDTYKKNGVNVIYFHVRSHCDANYRSKYEPWSKFVGGTRGKEPAFDPLEVMLREAHERGIEVYAWFNPYRYCGVYTNGESPLDYENSHPEWLIVQTGKETILNPALEEVQQRICDVVADVIENYDVDGIIFDDYFYSNPTPNSLDADLYEAAKAANPNVGTQLEWRISNVNNMVRRVSETIKSLRPYMPFGIAPAGIASPPNIKTKYGLDPISGDWQYQAIASDPISWYAEHYIDFMAPQVYWPNKFDNVQEWWVTAARHFDRHLYSAVTLSELTTYGSEFSREVEHSRDLQAQNTNGINFFRHYDFINGVFRYDNAGVKFPDFMGSHCFAEHALMPVRHWNNDYKPAYITGLKRDGSTLTWDAVEGMRYTVYAFKAGEEQRPYNTNLVQVRYTNTFEIPDELKDCTFGVAVYDRYGNEYSMSTEGGKAGQAVIAKLTYPANGAEAADLFDLAWEPTGCDNVVEVSETPDFATLVVQTPVSGNSLSSYSINKLESGKTYYWRVRTAAVNAPVGLSEVRSFKASRVAVTGPTGKDATTTPTITWTPAYDGSQYAVEISRVSNFSTIAYTETTASTSLTVPSHTLYSGYRYYVRVTAMRDGRSSTSAVADFSTADASPAAPTFITPATEGATVYSDNIIEILPGEGASSAIIQISASPEFTGGVYRRTVRDGDFTTPEIGKIKISGKTLTDGATYYVRAISRYFTQSNSSVEQEGNSAVSSFVYSAEAGVNDVFATESAAYIEGESLVMANAGNSVAVYATDGSEVLAAPRAGHTLDLSTLAPGLYIIKVTGADAAVIKWSK